MDRTNRGYYFQILTNDFKAHRQQICYRYSFLPIFVASENIQVMSKYFLSALLLFASLFWGRTAAASNPVSWLFSVKKTQEGQYRLEATATIESGFHIWAQDPGGDGSLIPTSFTTEQLQGGTKWNGDWKEEKAPKVHRLEYIDGDIRWHEKEITFYRELNGKKGDKIKGAVQFQTCNDMMCLPPAIENFIVSLN